MDYNSLAQSVGQHLGAKPNSRGHYNFRCPLCGDSQKNSRKKRGWLINDHGKYNFYCHNGCGGMTLVNFANRIMPNIDVREFSFQSEIMSLTDKELNLKDVDIEKALKESKFVDVLKNTCTPLSDYDDSHMLKSYLLNRKVMRHKLEDIFEIKDLSVFYENMCKSFARFTEYEGFFNGLSKNNPDAVAICYPFRMENGMYDRIQLQISNHSQKYIILNLVDDHESYAYGISGINRNVPIFICEGTVDSLMFDNCISSVTGNALVNVASLLVEQGVESSNLFLVYDRDFYTNVDVYKQFEKAMNSGFNLYFYDDLGIPHKSIDEIKDLNDIVCRMNVSGLELRNSIYKNSKSDFEAIMFNQMWNNLVV